MSILLLSFPGLQGGDQFAPLPPTSAFCLVSGAWSIIVTTIWVIGSKYLIALKKEDFDVVEAKIQEASMI